MTVILTWALTLEMLRQHNNQTVGQIVRLINERGRGVIKTNHIEIYLGIFSLLIDGEVERVGLLTHRWNITPKGLRTAEKNAEILRGLTAHDPPATTSRTPN